MYNRNSTNNSVPIVEKPDEQNFSKYVSYIENKSFRNKFVALLVFFSTLFVTKITELGKTAATKHHIDTEPGI